MSVSGFLARKFLSGKSRSLLVSSLTMMAVFGVAISVAAFLVVQAVMAGFGKDIRGKVLGFSSHVVLTLKPGQALDPKIVEDLRARKGVAAVAHILEGEAIVRTEDGEIQGVRVRGIDLALPPDDAKVKYYFSEGEDWSSLAAGEERLPGVLLGGELTDSLGVIPFLKEKIELIYPFGEVGPSGELEPNVRPLRVVGRFKSGYFEYDNKYAMVDLTQARRLLGDSGTEQLGIFLDDPFAAAAFRDSLPAWPGVERAKTWGEMHRGLFQVLRLERVGMSFVLGLMILLATFNILSLLMMLVFQRRREIGVLKALGLSGKRVAGIFLSAGARIGILGAVLGAAAGVGIILALSAAGLRLPAPYYIDKLPIEVSAGVVAASMVLAFFISLLASLAPAVESRRLSIIEAIRNE